MMQVGQLIKQLRLLNPQSNPARLALFNYLHHTQHSEAPLTAQVLNTFFCLCMDYPHWHQNKTSFSHEMRRLIVSAIMEAPARDGGMPDFDRITWPHHFQIVELESTADFIDVTYNYVMGAVGPDEEFRLVNESQKRLFAIMKTKEGLIKVLGFDRKMLIRNGQLEPLRANVDLTYDQNLSLLEGFNQSLDLSPYTHTHFQIIGGEVGGSAYRGYLFQKLSDFKGGPISEYEKLHFAIKRIEEYFVERDSDPFYHQTIANLEMAIHLMKLASFEQLEFVQKSLSAGETLLEQVFVGDKALAILVQELNSLLRILWQKYPERLQNQIKNQTLSLSLKSDSTRL